jgi:multidrug efflux pump subunit AcrA (membrane-fusion protein)
MPILAPRVLVLVAAVSLGGSSLACVDAAHCEAALAGVAEARAESALREQQLARLAAAHAQLAAQVERGTDAEREALRQRLALLEAENAALSARVELAERKLALEGAAAARASSARRRLDPAVPYDLAGFLARPRTSGKQESTLLHRATRPSRRLDPMVPYESGAVTLAPAEAATPTPRHLDEEVPY